MLLGVVVRRVKGLLQDFGNLSNARSIMRQTPHEDTFGIHPSRLAPRRVTDFQVGPVRPRFEAGKAQTQIFAQALAALLDGRYALPRRFRFSLSTFAHTRRPLIRCNKAIQTNKFPILRSVCNIQLLAFDFRTVRIAAQREILRDFLYLIQPHLFPIPA